MKLNYDILASAVDGFYMRLGVIVKISKADFIRNLQIAKLMGMEPYNDLYLQNVAFY